MAVELDNFIEKVSNVPKWEIGNENEENASVVAGVLFNSYRGEELKRPDGYYIDDGVSYVIEHFEFDSSEPVSGSKNRRELDRANKYFRDNVVLDTVLHQQLKCDYKYSFYKARLEEVFKRHYDKIHEYKDIVREKMSTDKDNIKTIFCIEDTSALGSIHYDEDGHKIILAPTYCLSFLELFEKSTDLDAVITYSEGSSSNQVVTYLDRENLQSYKKYALRDEEIKLINWNVNIASIFMLLP